MKINFIAFAETQEDRKAWSGTVYSIYKALERLDGVEVSYISCALKSPFWHDWISKFLNVWRFLGLTKRHYIYTNSFLYRRLLAKELRKKRIADCDVIVVVAYSVIVAALPDVNRPIIYFTDSTYSALEDYYPEVSDLFRFSSRQANAICKEAYERSAAVVVSSQWAKRHAVDDYGIDSGKVNVIEFGANLESECLGRVHRDYSGKSHFNILLSGVSWHRKGGEVAVECCRKLVSYGVNLTLNVVRMDVPQKHKGLDFIKEYGFLDKNDPAQYRQYLDLLVDTDIFLFPTKAECLGIVACEASGYGIPIFTYDTGGVPGYVINGINGYRLGVDSVGADFADCIRDVINRGELGTLSEGGLKLYREKLNWDVFGMKVARLLESI